MQNFRTWAETSTSWGTLGTAIIALMWRAIVKRERRVKANRDVNKRACDSFIRTHGLPDYRSIVWAFDGIARQESREAYFDRKQGMPSRESQRHRKETYIVVSMIPDAHRRKSRLPIYSPMTLMTKMQQCACVGMLFGPIWKRSCVLREHRHCRHRRIRHGSHHQRTPSQAARPRRIRSYGAGAFAAWRPAWPQRLTDSLETIWKPVLFG